MCLHQPKHHGENQRVQITQRMDNVSIHVWRPHVMTQRSQILAPRKKGTRINHPKTRSLEAKECRLYTCTIFIPCEWQNSVSPHLAQNQAIHCCLRSKELSTWNHMIRSKIPANIFDAYSAMRSLLDLRFPICVFWKNERKRRKRNRTLWN